MPKHADLAMIVVDDMEVSCATIRAALTRTGYTDVRVAGEARQALEMLRERRADVVLADWVMPCMDGLTLTECIRRLDEETNRYTAVILFTAKEGVDALVEAFERGVDDYLTKPLDERELAARVHAAGRISTLQNTQLETTAALTRFNRQLEELATTDPLTGLGNRRYLESRLNALLLETTARGGATCCVMIDIDHFKAVNDRYGHDVGDEVLKSLATRLRRAVRPTDIVVRMGGEEFAVVMYYPDIRLSDQPASPAGQAPPYTTITGATLRRAGLARPTTRNCAPAANAGIFERILGTIQQRPITTSAGPVALTISMGVCCHTHGTPPTPEALLKCADEKLYAAKEAGRNRVVY